MSNPQAKHIPQSLELCRLMHPQDANIAGNVHGGTILKMIEDAGMIATTRYCNHHNNECEKQTSDDGMLCVLARVERTDFCQPMYVGEVSSLHAEITYCSPHSLEIKVDVSAENVIKATKRLTNRATLWYTPIYGSGGIGNVPKLLYPSPAAEASGKERYEQQKKERKEKTHPESGEWKDFDNHVQYAGSENKKGTVAYAQSSLIHLVNVGDCGFHGNVTGGVTMKMMDEVAGICAARHCQSAGVVTASMDAMDLHQPIKKGSIMHLKSRPTFTSAKSIEVQVVVDVERIFKRDENNIETEVYRACSAFFTFVALGPKPERKVQAVPPLILITDGERERFEQGKDRYTLRKQKRMQQT